MWTRGRLKGLKSTVFIYFKSSYTYKNKAEAQRKIKLVTIGLQKEVRGQSWRCRISAWRHCHGPAARTASALGGTPSCRTHCLWLGRICNPGDWSPGGRESASPQRCPRQGGWTPAPPPRDSRASWPQPGLPHRPRPWRTSPWWLSREHWWSRSLDRCHSKRTSRWWGWPRACRLTQQGAPRPLSQGPVWPAWLPGRGYSWSWYPWQSLEKIFIL